jgi:hypothetical protein
MPPQDRGGSDDQPHRGLPVGWQRPGEQGQPRPVRPRQPRMSARPLAQDDSKLMAQHQDLGVLPPRLPPGQAQHRHSMGGNEEDQLQAHKPKIIAWPPACNPATSRHAQALPLRPPRRIRPGGMRFQRPQVRFLAWRRDGLVRRTIHRRPAGQPAARDSRWVVSATCLSSCTAPSWSSPACQVAAGSSRIACSSVPVMAQPQGEHHGAAPGRQRQQVG